MVWSLKPFCSYVSSCFFFFQAEDGIRDSSVTGVQTCALPIFTVGTTYTIDIQWLVTKGGQHAYDYLTGYNFAGPGTSLTRSEERRVGKECRSRWSPYH